MYLAFYPHNFCNIGYVCLSYEIKTLLLLLLLLLLLFLLFLLLLLLLQEL